MHLNEAGTLDQDFGVNGIVSIDIPGYTDPSISEVLTTGSGSERKIYFTGWVSGGGNVHYLLGRLNSDGKVDTSFGVDGLVIGLFERERISKGFSLALQEDGKIVLFGEVRVIFTALSAAARFNPDGTLDTDFGTEGYTVLEIEPEPSTENPPPTDITTFPVPHGVKILSDGKILGFRDHKILFADQTRGLIIRLDKKGLLDHDYNQGLGYSPVMHPDYVSDHTIMSNILVQADGKYVACGNVYKMTSRVEAMFARYDIAGNLDPTFGKDGFVTVAADTDSTPLDPLRINYMAQQPNHRILGVGSTGKHGVMISLEPDGTPNIQFNAGKPLYTVIEPEVENVWFGAAIQKNGRIVVVGAIGAFPHYDIVVARFIGAQFDPDFNGGKGYVRIQISSEHGDQLATGVTLQDDGKILVCTKTPDNKCTLLRFHA
jgi:uncharacterized delta-60 repeat protein